jgi:hypothetical protein
MQGSMIAATRREFFGRRRNVALVKVRAERGHADAAEAPAGEGELGL